METLREFEKLVFVENNYSKKLSANEFFKKHRNKYCVVLILSYFPKDERFPFRTLNSVFVKAMMIGSDFEQVKEMKKEFKKIVKQLDFAHFISSGAANCFSGLSKFSLYSEYRLSILNQFITSWIANSYFNKNEDLTAYPSLILRRCYNKAMIDFIPLMCLKIKHLVEMSFFYFENQPHELVIILNCFTNRVNGIEIINFNTCKITLNIVEKLNDLNLENVKTFSLINCNLSNDEILLSICSIMKKMFIVEKIFLDNNCFSEEAIRKILIPTFGKLGKLETISFGNNKIDDQSFNSICKYVQSWRGEKITTINIGQHTYTRKDFNK
jgi:hypothetical protein